MTVEPDAFIPHLPQHLIIGLVDIYSNFSSDFTHSTWLVEGTPKHFQAYGQQDFFEIL